MEQTEEIRKETAGIIKNAAEHAGEGNYSKARSKISEAMQKIYWTDAQVYHELDDIKGILEMLPEPDQKGHLPRNMRNWLLTIMDHIEE